VTLPAKLSEPIVAMLSTIDPDGTPQTSPVWFGVDGDDVVVPTADGRRKVRNIQRDPRVSVIVWDPADPDRYVEIRGTAVVEPDPGRALSIDAGERYGGPGHGAVYRDLPAEHVRVTIRITPTRVVER
jgi:PPOX class probable F420-dependent enzyme